MPGGETRPTGGESIEVEGGDCIESVSSPAGLSTAAETFSQRQEQRVSRSTAYFSILQHEWFGEGGVGETLATWLDDKNFEPSGQQRTRLSDLTAAVRARL